MLKAEGPDRFRVDFGAVKREVWWKRPFRALSSSEGTLVDGFAISQAIAGAMRACPFRAASGAPQVWNEYRLFLSRDDHDRLRPLERRLQEELAPLLYEELVRQSATTVGALVVRLLVDDEASVEPGFAILHARHTPDPASLPTASGEVTMRLGAGGPTPGALSTPALATERLGPTPSAHGQSARLTAPGGALTLPLGRLVVLGRSHPDAPPEFLAIPGASARINRRQLRIRVLGSGAAIVGREPGDATNPVLVGDAALAPGEDREVPLPVQIVLSHGELTLTLHPPE